MSTPFGPTLGVTGQIAEDEWQVFLRRRQEMLAEITARMSMSNSLAGTMPEVDEAGRQTIADALFQAQRFRELENPSKYAEANSLDRDVRELRGRAQYYAGEQEDLSDLSPDELMRIVMQGRERGRDVRRDMPENEEYLRGIERGAGAALVGVMTPLARATNIPFIGDALSKQKWMQDFQGWMGKFDEGYRTDLYEGEETAYAINKFLGSAVGYYIPGTLAMGAAGTLIGGVAATGIASRLGPIGKMALGKQIVTPKMLTGTVQQVSRPLSRIFSEGALATWMLEGGGEEPWSTRAMYIGAGGAIAVGLHGLIGMTHRLEESFSTKWLGWTAKRIRPEPLGGREGIDWDIEPPGQIGPGQRQVGAGEPPFVAPSEPVQPTGPAGLPQGRGPRTNFPQTEIPGQPIINPEVIRTRNALVAVNRAPSAPRGFEPDWGHELPMEFIPPAEGGYARMVRPTGQPNELRIKRIEQSGEGVPIAQAIRFDETGAPVAVFSQLLEGPSAGAFKTVVRPDAVRQGWATTILDEVQAKGLDVISGFEKNTYTESGRAFAISYLQRKEAGLLGSKAPEIDAVQQAGDDGITLTKRASIMESPMAPFLASQATFDDADVGLAILETNLGGISVLRNVGDVAQTVTKLTRKTQGRLMPHQIRVVERDVNPETVWAPALYTQGQVLEGAPSMIHADIYDAFDWTNPVTGEDLGGGNLPEHGFITSRKEYVSRDEAGQIELMDPGYQYGPGDGPDQLHSAAFRKLASTQLRRRKTDIKFIEPRLQTDILISEGTAITEPKIKDYKRFGFFGGQTASVGGVEVEVVKPGWPTTVRNKYTGDVSTVDPRSVIPGRFEASFVEGSQGEPGYTGLRNYVMQAMASEMQAAGLPHGPDWMGPEVTSQLPRLMDQYFDAEGIQSPLTRAALRNFFNVRRVEDFRGLMEPEEMMLLAKIQAESGKLISAAVSTERIITGLDEQAALAGFAIDLSEEGGFLLKDMQTGDTTPARTEAEIESFLRNYQREVPDVLDPGDAPEELLPAIPGASHLGTQPDPIVTTQARADLAGDMVMRIIGELAELGEAATPDDFLGAADLITQIQNDISAPEIDDIISKAKFEEGRVGAAMDPSLLRKLGANMYKGDPATIIIKEALQNSIDAIRNVVGGKIDIDIDFANRTFRFDDNGKGMSPSVMENEFMDPGGSFKEKGASGGYGLAKVGLFSNADDIKAVSVWQDADGTMHRTAVIGSSADWMTGNMKYKTAVAKPGAKTGTSLSLKIGSELEFNDWQATSFLDKFLKYNKTAHTINAHIDGQKYTGLQDYQPTTFSDQPSHSHVVRGAEVSVYESNESSVGNSAQLYVLNNGLFQFSDAHWFKEKANYPQRIIIDIKPTVDTESNDYPFTTSREELKSSSQELVNNLLKGMELVGGQFDYGELVGALKAGVKTGRGFFKVYSSSTNVPQELATHVASRPYAEDMSAAMSRVMTKVYEIMETRWTGAQEPVFGGLGLSETYLGVNLLSERLGQIYTEIEKEAIKLGMQGELMPRSDILSENMILVNPFNVFRDLVGGARNSPVTNYEVQMNAGELFEAPEDFENTIVASAYELASNTWGTLVHEVAHQMARGHDEQFSQVLTRLKAMVANHRGLIDEQVAEMAATWERALRAGFYEDYRSVVANYKEGEKSNVFKKISAHSEPDNTLVSLSRYGQGRPEVAGGGGAGGTVGGNEPGNVRGSAPPFLGSGAPRAYLGGTGSTYGRAGGGDWSPIPPFIGPAGGGGKFLPPGQNEVISQIRRRGPMAAQALNDFVTDLGFKWFNMSNRAMRRLDEAMQGVLGIRVRLADQYTDVSVGYTKSRNDQAPWMHEAEDIVVRFPSKIIRNGELVRIMEIGDANATIDEMTKLGFTGDQRQAVGDLREFLNRFFRYLVDDPAYNMDDSRFVFGYVSRVRARQLSGYGDKAWDDTENLLPHHLKFFAEESRKGQLDFRELHMGNILGRLIRGAMFHKHVRPAWETMAQTWDQDGIPEQVRAYIGGFLKFVQQGRAPQDDAIMVGVRHILNKVGIPATDQDMAAISGGMIGNMYRAYLGLRPDVVLREAMQWGMAGSKMGFGPIRPAFATFFGGGAGKNAMINRAIEKGWTEPGVPRGLYAGAFEEQALVSGSSHPFYSLEGPTGMVASQQKMADRREAWAQFVDHIVDRLPAKARQGIADTGLDPLYIYGKTTSMGKVIVGNAAYDHALVNIARFQRGEINIDQMHDILGSVYYGKPMRQAFDDYLHQGDLDGAASRYANDVVADSMLKTGGHEQPEGMRKMGTFGRMGLMFGTFSIGTLGWLASGTKGVGPKAAAKFLGRYGTLVAAAVGAEAATGFKFSRWLYHDALLFAGGPLTGAGLAVAQAYRGGTNLAQGYTPSAGEMEAFRTLSPAVAVPQLLRGLNPYSGGFRTVDRLIEGSQTSNPLYYNSRFLTTGERPGAAQNSDVNNALQRYGRDITNNTWTPPENPTPPKADTLPPFIEGGGAFQ